MIRNQLPYIGITGLFMVLGIESVIAQAPIKKEVEVVKPYQPVVSAAQKISILPVIDDSTTVKPTFQYNVVPTMLNTEYHVTPISAARMLGAPLTKLYKGYLKLGYGNYSSPLAELYVNSLRSKKYSAGAYLNYLGSTGHVTLGNKRSVFSGYSNFAASIFGKRYLRRAYLYASADFKTHTVYDYGYNFNNFLGYDTILNRNDIRQHYLLAGFSAGVRSMHPDSVRMNYKAGLNVTHYSDRFSHQEEALQLGAGFSGLYHKNMVGLDVDLNRLQRNHSLDSTGSVNSLFVLKPWISFGTGEYHIRLGINATFENQMNDLNLRLYPMAEFQFVVVKNVLLPFMGVYGMTIQHSYRSVTEQNPFVRPDLLISNANDRISYYGGVKGSLGAGASYICKLDYSTIDHQYFYVNDSTTKLQNQFTVVYSNGSQFTGTVDLHYDYSHEWSFGAKLDVYQYTLNNQRYAWEKPAYDAILSSRYNLRNKIIAGLSLLTVGKRYVMQYNPEGSWGQLPATVQFNLALEYRYTKILSFWLHFNNFTALKYDMWNFYPSERFNMRAGFSYSL